MTIDEYTTEYYNLSTRVGLDETDEQLTTRYLVGLRLAVRDKLGIRHVSNLDDTTDMAQQVEEHVLHYGPRQPLSSRATAATNQKGSAAIPRGVVAVQGTKHSYLGP